jgi:hypothetical protein
VKDSDWNNPLILRLGEQYAAEAYDLASELHACGADAAQLLLPREEKDLDRRDICLPPMLGDVVMALLLSLSRPSPNGGRRLHWSARHVETMMTRKGMSLRAAARAEAERTGTPADTIERGMRARKNERGETP